MALWLSDRGIFEGPRVVLCRSEKEYLALMRKKSVEYPNSWLMDADACTHTMTASGAPPYCVVCIDARRSRGLSRYVVIGLLVHEAVHCWQNWCKHIGEDRPGAELEAWGIQSIAQDLIGAFFSPTRGKQRAR